MAIEIPDQPPTEIRAGDSAHWTRTFSDYPAGDGWVLSYTLVGTSAVYSFNATASGDAFDAQRTAAQTAAWAAGTYTLVEYVTLAAERKTLGTTTIKVLQNLAAAVAGVDLRTPAKRMLDTIEAWMSTQSPVHGSVQYGDRRVDQYSPTELLAIRSRLLAEVANEEGGGKGLVRRMVVQL